MAATIIDGKAFAARVRGEVAGHVTRLKEAHGIVPGLAVVLVGEDPASQVYVRSKGRQTVEAGMASFEHRLDASVSEAELLAVVARLNAEVNRALALPEVAEQFAREGAVPVPTTPQAFGELIRREIPRWAEVVKAGNVKPD